MIHWRAHCWSAARVRTSVWRFEPGVSAVSARRFVLLAVASGFVIAHAGCGDDQPPMVYCPGGGNGGASAHGGAGGGQGGASAGASGAGGATGGAGGSIAGGGGAAGSVVAGRGGNGGSSGGAGTGGMAGSGAAGRGGSGGTGGGAGHGGAGGFGGGGSGGTTPTPGYTGCSHTGGVYRISVTKQASAGTSGKCFDLVLWSSTQTPPAGLTLPQGWSLMSAVSRPCTGEGASTPTTSVTGSVSWDPQFEFNLPPVVNLNVMLAFAANDAGVPTNETMNAQFVD